MQWFWRAVARWAKRHGHDGLYEFAGAMVTARYRRR